METWNIPYLDVYQYKSTWNTSITPAASGAEQRRANWDSAKKGWSIEMKKSIDIINAAIAFFDARKGMYEAFYFVPPKAHPEDVTPTPVKVRFDSDTFEAAVTYGAGTFTLNIVTC
jgi:phage-related protein